MYYVALETPMMSSVIADCPDLTPPNILDKSTPMVSRLLRLTLVSWATARVCVHRLSLCLPYLGVIPSLFFTCHWISFVFLLYGRCICTHSVDPSLTHFLGEFPGLGLALIRDVMVPEAEQGCSWSRNLDPNFCP